ncbi:hypothetical protein DICVIV_10479 [Dictyocaulus viviparus]|uniref:Uncharacterized protein n=1 Tax=Dictyocaulus viviparus TaxID=29172 RepID=A0A0D8XI97_DICVI|nr:hypothetical protein DICVIV_10479 [Dictyocaulus viviparus]
MLHVLIYIATFLATSAYLHRPLEAIVEHSNLPNLLSRGSYIGEQNDEYEYGNTMNGTLDFDNEDHFDDHLEGVQGDSEVNEDRHPNLESFLSNISQPLNRNEDRGVFIGDNRNGINEVKPEQRRLAPIAVINSVFNNRKSFACPKIKTDLKTGTSIGDLSPEDIRIIASMGDALATGMGLWPKTNIEFRGAAFPSGGDATIDGLVTIPS